MQQQRETGLDHDSESPDVVDLFAGRDRGAVIDNDNTSGHKSDGRRGVGEGGTADTL
jgi:hypothetical protein